MNEVENQNIENIFIIKKARDFAILKHGDQKYGDNEPYVSHLDDVSKTLEIYNFKKDTWTHLHVVAYLHDILEDTDCTQFEISENFGVRVLFDVICLTDEPGKNRAERHLKTYPKLRESWAARVVKLSDRISNVEKSYWVSMFKPTNDPRKKLINMYIKEHSEFYKNLYFNQDGLIEMWNALTSMLGGYVSAYPNSIEGYKGNKNGI